MAINRHISLDEESLDIVNKYGLNLSGYIKERLKIDFEGEYYIQGKINEAKKDIDYWKKKLKQYNEMENHIKDVRKKHKELINEINIILNEHPDKEQGNYQRFKNQARLKVSFIEFKQILGRK